MHNTKSWYLINSCVPLVRIKRKGFVIKIDNVLRLAVMYVHIYNMIIVLFVNSV